MANQKNYIHGETFFADLATRVDPTGERGLDQSVVKLVFESGLRLAAERAKERVGVIITGLGTFYPSRRKPGIMATGDGVARHYPGKTIMGFRLGEKLDSLINGA